MITLKKLRIKGFRAFMEEKEFSFETPAILLFGENHNGKSSTLNAIEWCLFGNECVGTKSCIRERVDWEIPNRNLGSHPNVSIELKLEDQDKKNYKIYRRYKSKTRDELKVTLPDGQILEEEEAQKKIFYFLKSSYRDFLTTAYQHQEAIRAILTQEPRERNDAIDRLLGLSEYRNILSVIEAAKSPTKQKEMGSEFDKFTGEIDIVLSTRERDLKDSREKAIQKGLKEDQISEKGVLSISREVKIRLEKFSHETGLALADLTIPEQWKELHKFQELANDEIKRFRVEMPDVKKQKELFSQQTEFISLRTNYEKKKQDYKDIREKFENFTKENGDEESLSKAKADIETQIFRKEKDMNEADARASTVSKAMEYLRLEKADKNICPVCGKETTDLLGHLKEEWERKYKEQVGKIQEEIDELRSQLKSTESLVTQYKKLKENAENVQGEINEVIGKIAGALKKEITEKDDPLVILNNELDKIKGKLDRIKEAVEAKQNTLNTITLLLEQAELITGILNSEEKKKIVEEITRSEEYQQMENLKDQMAVLVEDLAKIKQATSEASHEEAKNKLSTAKGMIDKYFCQITNNPSIKKIDLLVSSDSKMGKNNYEFKDHDGKDLTPILSQGDLNGLALSIFLGMATLKGPEQQLGFIMLDDPTQSLGSNHKEKLAEVLDEVLNNRMVILASMDKEFQNLVLSKISKSKTKYFFVDWTPETGPEILKD